jgi:DNA-binding transcriptional regulator YiaG
LKRKRAGGFSTFTLDDYLITENGEVINIKWGGRKVKPQPNGKGYLRVHIAGKMHFVHRLVAEKYVPNPNNYPQVNHKDGDKTNNKADNLEWVTNLQNRKHAVKTGLHVHGERCPWAKLSLKDVEFIREHTELTATYLANKFGVARATISAVKNYKSWR